MKAIIFTTDAIFALIIVFAAISTLLFFHYYAQTPFLIGYTDAQSLLNELSSVSVGALSGGNPLAKAIAYQNQGNGETWFMYQGDNMRSGGAVHGPLMPYISGVFSANMPLATPVVAGYGNYYFGANAPALGAVYAVNASYNAPVWNVTLSTAPLYIALYNNMLIYTTTASVNALQANNGAPLWSTTIASGTPASPIVVYGDQIIFGTSTNLVVSYYSENGTQAWSNNVGGVPTSIAVINGSIAVRTTASGGTVMLLSYNGGDTIWSESSTIATTNISVGNNLIAFGSGASGCALFINGSQDFCGATPSAVAGVSNRKGYIIYQSGGSVYAFSASGAGTWGWKGASGYGTPVYNPVISDQNVYSVWAGGYVIAENLTTGAVSWGSILPYTQFGALSLGYGKLYITSGSNVIVYGTCNADQNQSLLAASAFLYINNEGSCANVLLNSIRAVSNYSIFVNGSFGAGMHLAYFNGKNASVVASPLFENFFMYINPNTVGDGTLSVGLNGFAGGAIVNSNTSITPNRWSYVGFVNNPFSGKLTLYINGKVDSTAPSEGSNTLSVFAWIYPNNVISAQAIVGRNDGNMNTLDIGSRDLNLQFFGGSIANLQIYNSSLSDSQEAQLYREDLQGPPLKGTGNIAWYPLEGDANDYSGLLNTGYPINVSYAYGNYLPAGLVNAQEIAKGSAMLPIPLGAAGFNGKTSYIEQQTGYNFMGTQTQNFTISIWISPVAQNGVIVDELGPKGGGFHDSWIELVRGSVKVRVWNLGCVNLGQIPLNRWSNIVLEGRLASGTTMTYTGYINGVTAGSEAGVRSTPGAGSAMYYPLGMGDGANCNIAGVPVSFDGNMANYQFYNLSLTDSQIIRLYQEGAPGAPVQSYGLRGWWPLNGNANDYSVYNNQATANAINYAIMPSLFSTGVYVWR